MIEIEFPRFEAAPPASTRLSRKNSTSRVYKCVSAFVCCMCVCVFVHPSRDLDIRIRERAKFPVRVSSNEFSNKLDR